MTGTYWFQDLEALERMRSLPARKSAQLILDSTFMSGLGYYPEMHYGQEPTSPSNLWQDGEFVSAETLFELFMLDEMFDPLDAAVDTQVPAEADAVADELLRFILRFMARSGYERKDEHGESAYVWEPWFNGYNTDNGTIGARLTRAFTEMLRREFIELIPRPTPDA